MRCLLCGKDNVQLFGTTSTDGLYCAECQRIRAVPKSTSITQEMVDELRRSHGNILDTRTHDPNVALEHAMQRIRELEQEKSDLADMAEKLAHAAGRWRFMYVTVRQQLRRYRKKEWE